MDHKAKDFVDGFGRRVLTNGGQPGRDGKEGSGSTTEQMQGRVAAAIFANCDRLNDVQLDEIIAWVAAYKSRPMATATLRAALGAPAGYLWPSGGLRSHAIDPISDPDLAGKDEPLFTLRQVQVAVGAEATATAARGAAANEPSDLAAWHIEDAREQGMSNARSGVQDVSAGFGDLPFEGCPDTWGEKLFARIAWFYDSGDASVGEPAQAGWTLAGDQAGTVVADLARLVGDVDASNFALWHALDSIADELEAHPEVGEGELKLESFAGAGDPMFRALLAYQTSTGLLMRKLARRARAATDPRPAVINTTEG